MRPAITPPPSPPPAGTSDADPDTDQGAGAARDGSSGQPGDADGGGNPLIVALDVPELDRAVELARRLEGEVRAFKVGLELFGGDGPAAVERIATFGPVFLDVKLHDIPTTVQRAARRLARLGVTLLTVHALGGPAMVRAARAGMGEGTRGTGRPAARVLAVTLLTSLSADDLSRMGLPPADEQVPRLAAMAVEAGADGVVCAPPDLGRVREAVGDGPLVVTPGVRPEAAGDDDHARTATPGRARRSGADLLVVGRPITRAADPVAAARSVVAAAGEAP